MPVVTDHTEASESASMFVTQNIYIAAPVAALQKNAKYKQALSIAKQLAEECSVMGTAEFQECIEVLKKTLSVWRAGRMRL